MRGGGVYYPKTRSRIFFDRGCAVGFVKDISLEGPAPSEVLGVWPRGYSDIPPEYRDVNIPISRYRAAYKIAVDLWNANRYDTHPHRKVAEQFPAYTRGITPNLIPEKVKAWAINEVYLHYQIPSVHADKKQYEQKKKNAAIATAVLATIAAGTYFLVGSAAAPAAPAAAAGADAAFFAGGAAPGAVGIGGVAGEAAAVGGGLSAAGNAAIASAGSSSALGSVVNVAGSVLKGAAGFAGDVLKSPGIASIFGGGSTTAGPEPASFGSILLVVGIGALLFIFMLILIFRK